MLSFLVVMLVAAAALAFVAWPLRAGAASTGPREVDQRLIDARDRAQLAKDRKLDEIRELRSDRAAGKLATADAAVLERRLRAEAADLLHALDAAEAAVAEARGELDTATEQPAAAAAARRAAADDPASDRGDTPAREPEPLR